jgi:hypothetical protein
VLCPHESFNLKSEIFNLKSLDFLFASIYFERNNFRSFEKLVEAQSPRVNNNGSVKTNSWVVERGRLPKLAGFPFVGSSELVAAAKSAGLSP